MLDHLVHEDPFRLFVYFAFEIEIPGHPQARAEAELGAALAGERLRCDGELTEIKSVVDEMMILDPSASGGDAVGVSGDLFSPPRGAPRPRTLRSRGAGIVSVVDRSGGDTTRQISGYDSRTIVGGENGGPDRGGGGNDTAVLPRSGGLAWRSSLRTDVAGNNNDTSSVVSGAAARLAEAWSLLEASEAARRRLSEEVKGCADRAAGLEEALAAAEATAEMRAREARLLAASLQDARDGLALEEAARREAEGRADALRLVLLLSSVFGGVLFVVLVLQYQLNGAFLLFMTA